MHIRILAGSLSGNSGSSIYNRNLASQLAQRNYDVSVLAFDRPGDLGPKIDLHVISPPSFKQTPWFWRFYSPLRARYVQRKMKSIDLSCPDIVVAAEHYFIKPHVGRFPSASLLYVPHSLTVAKEIDGREFSSQLSRTVTRHHYVSLQRWAIKECKAVVRFSHYAADELECSFPVHSASRMVVNPMPVEIPTGQGERESEAASPIRLLFVGRLVESKGVDLLLTSLGKMRGGDWKLTIVGDGEQRASLEQLSTDLGIAPQVEFTGVCSNPGERYRKADLFVFPSRLESTGLVVLEAMSYGVPCLALASDGTKVCNANDELISHRQDGLLANGEMEFEHLLSDALNDPCKLRIMGMKARERIVNEHRWDKHMDRWQQIFDLCIE